MREDQVFAGARVGEPNPRGGLYRRGTVIAVVHQQEHKVFHVRWEWDRTPQSYELYAFGGSMLAKCLYGPGYWEE